MILNPGNKCNIKTIICLILFVFYLTSRSSGDEFIVTSSADSGSGSMREAISVANTTTGQHTLRFNVTAPITLLSPIDIMKPLIVEGKGTTIISSGQTILHFDIGSGGSLIRGVALIGAQDYLSCAINI